MKVCCARPPAAGCSRPTWRRQFHGPCLQWDQNAATWLPTATPPHGPIAAKHGRGTMFFGGYKAPQCYSVYTRSLVALVQPIVLLVRRVAYRTQMGGGLKSHSYSQVWVWSGRGAANTAGGQRYGAGISTGGRCSAKK
ncbi:hypothetical protein E2C01_043881 [Portunus trituberculatus]|uniref:Uncharacterized protein n=1 Tax=Portunus trituberculatus TaxID=210409 RepID=A0A5B7FXX6_PORTR|nr:hypothetical protein [Portunus trituberculatus]